MTGGQYRGIIVCLGHLKTNPLKERQQHGFITNDAGIREDEGAVQGLCPHVPGRRLLGDVLR